MVTDLSARPKAADAVQLFKQRIRAGAYGLRGIPGERKLAAELGVSYMSARKVVQALIDEAVLIRMDNGRLRAAAESKSQNLRIAFVAPAFSAQVVLEVQYELAETVAGMGGVVRPVTYVQPSDPIIFEALEGDFDGLFVILPVNAPRLLIERLARHRNRVVILWHDLSQLGLLSIVTGPARFVGKGLDHLAKLGHTTIDCFNTLPHDAVVHDRIQHWRMGMEQRGLTGELRDFATRPFACSITAAYEAFKQMIADGLTATAYFCVTTEIGRGVLRACHEAGIVVGKDISVCGFSEISVAKLTVPSLTAVATAEPLPYLKMGLDWTQCGGEGWQRPLRLEPDDVAMFIGESTGPAPSVKRK